jgi:hypothetical protein
MDDQIEFEPIDDLTCVYTGKLVNDITAAVLSFEKD